MLGKMHVIKPESLLNALLSMNNGTTHLAEIPATDFIIEQFTTRPLNGFDMQKVLPSNSEALANLMQIANAKMAKFPDCCKRHAKLHGAPWFNKEHYNYVPQKFINTLAYTWHCIGECIEHENWFKEITDYIEYTIQSYGQLPDGYGSSVGIELYYDHLTNNLESESEIPAEKKKMLISFLQNYRRPAETFNNTDLNALIGVYKEWMSLFPFEISFFQEIKPYFEKQMPLLTGPGHTNIYTGLTAFKLKSKKQLLDFLQASTLLMLKEINTKKLCENNLLTDIKKTQLEILLAKRKMELEELDNSTTSDKHYFIKLLKKWLNGEKRFLAEATPLISEANDKLNFINDMIDGIELLQNNDTNEPCIVAIREDQPHKESLVRYFFKNFLTGRYKDTVVTAEEEKGDGRIDLKIYAKKIGNKIIEFKGWWNSDKDQLVEQLCGYLSDFENDGYIFMINHNKTKNISSSYQEKIMADASFIAGSWKEHLAKAGFRYFESAHTSAGKVKTIYHFIFNVYF